MSRLTLTAAVLALGTLIPACGPGTAADAHTHAAEGEARLGEVQIEGRAGGLDAVLAMHGQPAPALSVTSWANGEAVTLADLQGKVVLLDFWGTWCPPCRKLTPLMIDLANRHEDDGLVVIGVHTSRGGATASAYADEHDIPYRVAVDGDDATVKAYQVNGYPDIYLIDRQGRVAYADVQQAPFENVERAVQKLLAQE